MPSSRVRVPSCHMQMRRCITLPVFGVGVLLMGDLFGQRVKPGVAYHLPGMKTTDDNGLDGFDFGDDCGKEQLLTGSMSCLVQFVVLL